MSKVAELTALVQRSDKAAWISNLWDKYNNQRKEWLDQKQELRNYIFATDTTTTSNSSLPWGNTTTLPKLCQIRDNLHSNYLTALFPNENWLQWESFSNEDSLRDKAQVIENYMAVKCRRSGFRDVVSQLLYDYIDYGNVFALPSFEKRSKILPSGREMIDYIGAVAHRVSPLDIVFNPLAESFEKSFKIVRSLKSIGELKKLALEDPDQAYWAEAITKRLELQRDVVKGGYSVEDFEKAIGFTADGFGNYYEYLMSEYVEVLEFWGDYHNAETGELSTGRLITVVDRTSVVRDTDIPTYAGKAPIHHVGWRKRPDNLWAMSPLDNLVGMQYRIDHLENLKADACDLIVNPPIKIMGEVEEFEWRPGATIHLDEQGDVGEVSRGLNGIFQANNDISILEDKMELYAGAPREAMGIRSPGEKTAFEVDQLQAAAGRIFQEKVTAFELLLLEPLLNDMLEVAHRNLDRPETIGVMDEELDATVFRQITADDIVGDGILHPVGARHFAEQAKFIQNITTLSNTPAFQMVAPHVSAKALSKAFASALNVEKLGIFKPHVALEEQMEMQKLSGAMEEQMMVEQQQASPEEGMV